MFHLLWQTNNWMEFMHLWISFPYGLLTMALNKSDGLAAVAALWMPMYMCDI
jgi:hypothetical protein